MTVRPEYDVVIVGGGIAGLAAANRLSGLKILVLEAAGRPGGRIHSQPSGDYWLNFGAHMFGGPGSLIGDLVDDLGLETKAIRGSLLGVSSRGKRLFNNRLETIPFRLPLPLAARLSFIKMGIGLRLGSEGVVKALKRRAGETGPQWRARIHAHDNGRTLAEALGSLHPEIAEFLDAFTERTGGSPDEMAAGYALRSFTNVWSQHSPGFNLFGGSAGLPNAIATRLGDAVQLGAQVSAVRASEGLVRIEYVQDQVSKKVSARTAIVATPAYVTSRIVRSMPEETREALNAIRYGAFLSVAVRTTETGAMPWDNTYATATPDRAFSVLFNQATSLRTGPRQPGGSIMLFRGARAAARLMEKTDAQIEQLFLDDLVAEFPEARGVIDHAIVQRWPAGAPYSWPGRAALQPALTAPLGNIVLAGDYLEFPNMEAAVATGLEAAETVNDIVAAADLNSGHD
jgi:oxygen-dependent protoporphyrinogen oxidase